VKIGFVRSTVAVMVHLLEHQYAISGAFSQGDCQAQGER
jgi:hypothetical protein